MSKNNENRKIAKEKLATANSVDPKVLDFCSSANLKWGSFFHHLHCSSAVTFQSGTTQQWALLEEFFCASALYQLEKKTAHQQGITLLFHLLRKFFDSMDKVTGEGDIRTCSTYKRRTVGGIRRCIWSLKISQKGHCRWEIYFHYCISSKFQSSIPFKRWYVPSTWRCDSSPGMSWWLAISSVINKKSSVSLDIKTNQC